jgi:hypothetical protein
MYQSIVRVATSNNFNCTAPEYAKLDRFVAANPGKRFFVNCNARTPRLHTLLEHPYKAVITLNPDLDVVERVVARGLEVAEAVAFYRVKWLPERPDIVRLVERAAAVRPVVITMQRFNSKGMLLKYTDLKHYNRECSRFRLHGEALKVLEEYVDAHVNAGLPMAICDRRGLGCLGCGMCPTFNGGETDTRLESLNLKASGVCPYNCPDCYAKAMQKFLVGTGKRPMRYDTIMRNKKQSGQTKHIKEARALSA